jgi:hypothetical protein
MPEKTADNVIFKIRQKSCLSQRRSFVYGSSAKPFIGEFEIAPGQ